MFRRLAIAVGLVALWTAGCDQAAPAPARDPKAVQADATAIQRAVHADDIEALLNLTHPVVIDALGGREPARKALEESLANLNIELESTMFPAEPQFIDGEVHEFVMVPTLSILKGDAGRVESLNFQFGARRKGTLAWKYIEGSRVNQQNVRQFFSDFPPDFVFPETYRKRIGD